jgi:hypothetical protein
MRLPNQTITNQEDDTERTKKIATESPSLSEQHPVRYKTIRVNELAIFYRDSG